jgi:glyoxylase-like metal-dependent hydrolase (beta-lactamase superfamily II)
MNRTDDWYEVTRLGERGYSIDEAEKYGSFLIAGDERSVLVDAGIGVGDLRGLVTGLVDTPITVVLTHTHWDHIGAAAQFDDVLVSPRELPADGRMAIDSLSEEFVDRPATFVDRWLADGGTFPDEFEPETYAVDPAPASAVPMADGIDLGDRTLDVYPLPGHSPGHLGLLDREAGVFYGGDIVHIDRGVYLMFEDCDFDEYVQSVAELLDLRDAGAFDTLATSHNEALSGDDLSILDTLYGGLREIADGERDYSVVETDRGEARSYRIGDSDVLTKTTL